MVLYNEFALRVPEEILNCLTSLRNRFINYKMEIIAVSNSTYFFLGTKTVNECKMLITVTGRYFNKY